MLRVKGYGNGISQDLLKTSRTNGQPSESVCPGCANSEVTWTFNPIQRTLRSPSQFLWERSRADARLSLRVDSRKLPAASPGLIDFDFAFRPTCWSVSC